MALRNRNGKWHYRFRLDGRRYELTTGLAATERNRREAQSQESEHIQALREGRRTSGRIAIRQFNDAAK